MSFVAFLTLYPIFYVVLGAFKKNQELLTGGINIFPSEWIVQNFIDAWNSANFAVYTGNSIFLALSVMILTLVVTSMAGYVFARKNFRGKELIYGLFVAFMFVNVGSVTLRPLFELAVKIHMNTSLWSVVFISAGTAQATYIFLIRGYMNSVPKELDEAAKIDGCTFFQTFYKIILPVLKPILATVALLSFRGGWNEYILPLVFTMTDASKRPLSGNVRDKLRVAKAMAADTDDPQAERFAANAAALEKVQPEWIEASDIDVKIGTTWIEPLDYEQFIYELLDRKSVV